MPFYAYRVTACVCQLLQVKAMHVCMITWSGVTRVCVTFMVFISIYRPKWIKYQGTVYHLTQFVLSGWQGNDLPQFSKIEELISIQDVAIMVATHYRTVGIDRHYHSYLIASTRCKSVVPLANVDSYPPVNVCALPSGMYLTLRYHVLNECCTSVWMSLYNYNF